MSSVSCVSSLYCAVVTLFSSECLSAEVSVLLDVKQKGKTGNFLKTTFILLHSLLFPCYIFFSIFLNLVLLEMQNLQIANRIHARHFKERGYFEAVLAVALITA